MISFNITLNFIITQCIIKSQNVQFKINHISRTTYKVSENKKSFQKFLKGVLGNRVVKVPQLKNNISLR